MRITYTSSRSHYMWVSGAINITDYTETVTLAITRVQTVNYC